VGYLAINSITGMTRSWLMGQGHCVAAIDATNLMVDNMTNAHAKRYKLSDEGLSRFARDFYSYRVRADGRPESPLGSHVNPYTAGGMLEGGYLGFAELYYAHMPLPGERLVTFLSDGAFEEQRGSDWVPRWWRGEDCGLIAPFMIANGRRIDQRSTMSQVGGVDWFRKHLRINGFDPLTIDGRDPASFACGVFEMEERLISYYEAVKAGEAEYPAPVPYGIANTIKGYGFPGAGTNFAHNLPLGTNPAQDMEALQNFNLGSRDLWVPHTELNQAIKTLNNHAKPKRPKEKDHPLAWRKVSIPELPKPYWRTPDMKASVFPMDGLDAYFCSILQANPELRPRVGNPDEMRSNRMNATLDLLKHRVTAPEAGIAEAVDGSVITALNEEAVVCAALANKGGISIAVSYEAFAVKMLGAIRQEIIFARHQNEAGAKPKWLSIPIVVSSHAWENGKNELSHQDPTLCETLMGEMSDVSRVVFPADWNTAIATLQSVYSNHGQIWTMVMPKRAHPVFFDSKQAQELIKHGALKLYGNDGDKEQVILAAVGSYQLMQALRASARLNEKDIPHRIVYIIEPGRFRSPRDEHEAEMMASSEMVNQLFPDAVPARVFLSHMRPETLQGVIRPLDTGSGKTKVLGFINHGGTLNEAGMLFANRCTWAHAVAAVAETISCDLQELLTEAEIAAISGKGDPYVVLT
jgi:phosphoketolase